ncbi:unnamed protein product [Somion occarium]|uniref:RING-type domain-containing protein n=1 Tax=Somion occarium TaxID=3059160 RepID=A0ABP1DHU4_9APHY
MSCPICKKTPEIWSSISCGHVFCEHCITAHVQTTQARLEDAGVANDASSTINCPYCGVRIDRNDIRQLQLPRELLKLPNRVQELSVSLGGSRRLHRYWNRRGVTASKRAAELDDELTRARQNETNLRTTVADMQMQIDDITARLEATQLDLSRTRQEREQEVTRLSEELQAASYEARLHSIVTSALSLRALTTDRELSEQRGLTEHWRARYDEFVRNVRHFRRSENAADALMSGSVSSVSPSRSRRESTSSSTSFASCASALSGPLSPLAFQPTSRLRHSTRLRDHAPHRPTTESRFTVQAYPKPMAPVVTQNVPHCEVVTGHVWSTAGSNGFMRKFTCAHCRIMVKERKSTVDGVLVWVPVSC